VRIVSGLGAGQVRTITANDATSLTVAAWTITPNATSVFVIEGNDDFLYLLGNNAVTMYRYSISGNTWSTLAPGVARAGALAAGGGANWIADSPSPIFDNESAIINGRRIYSFRGGASNILDYYDIPSNAWVSTIDYGNKGETFTTGSCYDVDEDFIYISKEATGRIFRFIISENRLIPWSTLVYPNGTATVGDKMWTKSVVDGNTVIRWLYYICHTSTAMLRCLMIDQ
jgi:hypothetical protein